MALTSLAASLIAMSLSPVSPLRGRDLTVAIVVGLAYAALLAVPWTRHHLSLNAPHVGAVLVSALGAAIAMSTFTAARRWRADTDTKASPEHA